MTLINIKYNMKQIITLLLLLFMLTACKDDSRNIAPDRQLNQMEKPIKVFHIYKHSNVVYELTLIDGNKKLKSFDRKIYNLSIFYKYKEGDIVIP